MKKQPAMRLLSLCAGLLLMVPSLLLGQSVAAETTDDSGKLLEYEDSGMYTMNNSYISFGYTDKAVTITGCQKEMKGEVVVPDTLTGLPVVAVEEGAFYECTEVTAITLPDTVQQIGGGAFYGCTALTSVQLPDQLTALGESAFFQCTALPSITLPDGVTTIPESCFGYCESLASITFPPNLTVIGKEAFYGVNAMSTLTIPETVTEIGEMAFYFWNQLTEVTIPASVVTMGDYVFDGCDALTAISVAEGNPSFRDEDGVLMSADGTCLIKYPPKHAGTTYTVPDGVTKLAGWSFVGAEQLTGISLPNVAELGEDVFYHCTSLTDITLPATLTTLPSGAFTFCTALTQLTLPENLTTIGGFCFTGCTALSELTIPASVATIDQYAIGFDYDTETQTFEKLPHFTMHVLVGTVGMQYAKDNDISYRSNSKLGWILLIAAAVVLLLILVVVIVVVRRNRPRVGIGPDKGKPIPMKSRKAPSKQEK